MAMRTLLSSLRLARSSADGSSFAPDELAPDEPESAALAPDELELDELEEPCNEAVRECVAEQAMVPVAIDAITTRAILVRSTDRSLIIVMRTLLELHHGKTCVALSRRMPVGESHRDRQAPANDILMLII
ncbi:MAG TPA: hypothetical protein VLM79_21530 [Kofleriaceae bacterium]|nr:hypothetical protein [Kofleriaceae bacterium]